MQAPLSQFHFRGFGESKLSLRLLGSLFGFSLLGIGSFHLTLLYQMG